METSQELQVVRQTSLSMPEMNVETATERFQQLGQFVKTIMRSGVDYGIIPGTPKPTLLKPGAEKLCTFFGLSKEERILAEEKDWTGKDHGGEPFFYFHYQIRLSRNGQLVAEADGSANSWETKHRYRQGETKCPECGKETIIKGKREYGGGWICFTKKGGCGAKFPDNAPAIIGQDVGQRKNPNPADLVNTLQKMAYKRALVAVTLVGVNASEYFNQDIEDLVGIVDLESTPIQPTEKPQEARSDVSQPQGQGQPEKRQGDPLKATQAQIGMIEAKLSAMKGDRAEFKHAFGIESMKYLPKNQVDKGLCWIQERYGDKSDIPY